MGSLSFNETNQKNGIILQPPARMKPRILIAIAQRILEKNISLFQHNQTQGPRKRISVKTHYKISAIN
ncbi:hypothetical protein HY58_05405 [Flavihumibacter sp. ZG627]|nr:hypothetical protein HY58_05405 [Flavihumibacter sp. ZG627]